MNAFEWNLSDYLQDKKEDTLVVPQLPHTLRMVQWADSLRQKLYHLGIRDKLETETKLFSGLIVKTTYAPGLGIIVGFDLTESDIVEPGSMVLFHVVLSEIGTYWDYMNDELETEQKKLLEEVQKEWNYYRKTVLSGFDYAIQNLSETNKEDINKQAYLNALNYPTVSQYVDLINGYKNSDLMKENVFVRYAILKAVRNTLNTLYRVPNQHIRIHGYSRTGAHRWVYIDTDSESRITIKGFTELSISACTEENILDIASGNTSSLHMNGSFGNDGLITILISNWKQVLANYPKEIKE